MRKIIFILMLAIAGSVWTMSSALCIARAPQSLQQPTTLSGLLVMEGTPCESTDTLYPCLPCLTLAFQSNETLYYLTSDNEQTMSQLDEIEAQLNESQHATVTGILYQQGSYNYINVQNISLNNDHLPSLCDQWNVLHEPFSCMGPYCYLQTNIYRLTTDTLIQNVRYTKLMEQEGTYTYYKGALREGTNRDIYYVPTNSTNEYLIYAFNAQVGDELQNVWLGGETEKINCASTHNATVISISNSNPRIFTLEIIPYTSYEGMEVYPYWMNWIEGVGMSDGPVGSYDSNKLCTAAADMGVYTLLCAYNNGEQVYSSAKAEQYGCEFNGIPSAKPHSLCDEWNVLSHLMALGPEYESLNTLHYLLTSDTIFNGTRYTKFEQDGVYKGAMREGSNRDIYFIPAGSMHEYLLYAFNAKVGDKLENLWFGANEDEHFLIKSATVVNIESTTPREFIIDFEWQFINTYAAINDTSGIMHTELGWLEGLGFQDGGPIYYDCPFECAGGPRLSLLCAYMDGEQVYTSEMGQKYGCYYDGNTPLSDTIPLYKDGPGSSTVQPVDPNQIVATLQKDVLSIFEYIGLEIAYKLTQTSAGSTPVGKRLLKSDTFQQSVAVTLTESGTYLLELTHPDWDYSIVGTFEYTGGTHAITSENAPLPSARKILRDGQLLIRKGDNIYTLTGVQIQ